MCYFVLLLAASGPYVFPSFAEPYCRMLYLAIEGSLALCSATAFLTLPLASTADEKRAGHVGAGCVHAPKWFIANPSGSLLYCTVM